jgi:hypothetical protein
MTRSEPPVDKSNSNSATWAIFSYVRNSMLVHTLPGVGAMAEYVKSDIGASLVRHQQHVPLGH